MDRVPGHPNLQTLRYKSRNTRGWRSTGTAEARGRREQIQTRGERHEQGQARPAGRRAQRPAPAATTENQRSRSPGPAAARRGGPSGQLRIGQAGAHLGPSRGDSGGHSGQPPAPAPPRCRGRAPGCGRRRHARADARTYEGPHADGPAAPAPRRGAESRAGEGSRRANGKHPKEATDRKRKWARTPPTAPLLALVAPASANPPGRHHFRRKSYRHEASYITSAR